MRSLLSTWHRILLCSVGPCLVTPTAASPVLSGGHMVARILSPVLHRQDWLPPELGFSGLILVLGMICLAHNLCNRKRRRFHA